MSRWHKYWYSILGHYAQGAVAGLFITTGIPAAIAAGVMILALSMSYQWAGWAKYRDAVKRDTADYIAGFYIGLALGGALWLTRLANWPASLWEPLSRLASL